MTEDVKVEAGKVAEGEAPAVAEKAEAPKENMIPQSRFKEKVEEANSLKVELEEFKTKQREAEESALAKQGKYKELYETAQQEAEKAAADVKRMQNDALKRDVATKAGYPAMWNRIAGETAEDLTADMTILVEALPVPRAPNIDAGTGSGARAGEATDWLSDVEKKELAEKFGLDYGSMPEKIKSF